MNNDDSVRDQIAARARARRGYSRPRTELDVWLHGVGVGLLIGWFVMALIYG